MGTGTIIALVGSVIAAISGWGKFFFERNKTKAESNAVEINSSIKINQEWEKIFNKLKKETEIELQELRERVKHLEEELDEERRKRRALEKKYNDANQNL